MSKRARSESDASLLDDEPSLKKPKADKCYVWFNKVPSQITNWLLQQHLWSKYRLNAQPHLKTTIDKESYFYIESDANQATELINKSPITIKGHQIILSDQMTPSQAEEKEKCHDNDVHIPYYRILINNVPNECSNIELNKLFNKHGTLFATRCDNNNNNNNTNNGYKTASIDFANIESLANVAMALSIGALKIKPNELLSITIAAQTVDYLYKHKNKHDLIIADLIKFHLININMNAVAPNAESTDIINGNVIQLQYDENADDHEYDEEDEDEVSICDDEEESEMSISPNIITTDIKIIKNNEDIDNDDNDENISNDDAETKNKNDSNLIELKNSLEREEREFLKLLQQLSDYNNENKEEGEEDQSGELLLLREDEMKLNDLLFEKKKELSSVKVKLCKLEYALNGITREITKHKLHEKQQQIINQNECDIYNNDKMSHADKLNVLNKTNENLKTTINNLKSKKMEIQKKIQDSQTWKADANTNCAKYENDLKLLENELNESALNFETNIKIKMENKQNSIKSNLEIEQSKHSKSKLLLKQTVDSIQENLIKINNKNKEKDDLIFSLQKELQSYQSLHPWLMTL